MSLNTFYDNRGKEKYDEGKSEEERGSGKGEEYYCLVEMGEGGLSILQLVKLLLN